MSMGIQGVSGYGFYSNPVYGSGENNSTGAIDKNGSKSTGAVEGSGECKTCNSRKYQDGSNENVSFKAAAHISPESAAGAVRAHEGEHVSNAYSKAALEGGKVIRASVSIHTSVCPECGKSYVSGGTTNTAIKYSNEENPYVRNLKAQQAEAFKGQNIDYAA